jgi:hypothetical protein
MTAIHVVKVVFLTQGLRVQAAQLRLENGRVVDLRLGSTSGPSRLLVTTNTATGLPTSQAGRDNSILARRDVDNIAQRVIAITGRALDPASTQAWVPHPDVAELGAQLIKALATVLPEHQFV